MPTLTSNYYHFKEEIVDIYHGQITQAEVWYDLQRKLVRVDYRSPGKAPPLDTTDPLTEVHDFNRGVRYVKDLLTGACTPIALNHDPFDAKLNTEAYLVNGSYVMHMKNPLSFFFLDSNFTYTGQRLARDARCDVYISHRFDYDIYNNGSGVEAKVETYFLADGWYDFPDDGHGQFSQRFPFRVYLSVPKLGYSLVYNVFDYDTEPIEMSTFDVSTCYNDSSSLRFRVRFLGPYRRDTEHVVRIEGRDALARSMQVSPLRVTDINIENDASYLFLSATLLDRTPSLVQFTHLPKAVVEKQDDASWSNIPSAAACSNLCVNNPDILCQSFEYCPGDRGACRVSHLHVSDGTPTVVSNTCDLYSRTVDVRTPPELTVSQAWDSLWEDLKDEALAFIVQEDNEQEVRYMAVDAELKFGELSSVQLPTLTGQFSYRVEMVFPRHNLVKTYDVWYDYVSKLVRYDTRDAQAGAPYYSPFTITTIHDFNEGVAYNIDTHQGNCTVTTLPTNNTLDSQNQNWTLVTSSGIELIAIKSPLEIFYLDNTYKFTGQKTVRGILCDVLESKRTDLHIGSGTQHSIFQFFFQSASWEYDADSNDDITMQQPVQLVIMDDEANEFIVYNFYNFNDEHTSYDNFNIAPCFTDDQRIEFVLDFNQTYHPYLETREWRFKQEVQLLLASETKVSPLRVQNMQVTYNLDLTYVVLTLLGQVSPQLHFAETDKTPVHTAPMSSPQEDVVGCAASCYYNHQMVCNSFDLCPDQTCYLNTQHTAGGNVTNSTVLCRHFSRVVNGTAAGPELEDAFTAIKDLVYKGLFIVVIPVGDDGSKQVFYTATGVRDDILSQTPHKETGGVDLHTRFKLYRSGAEMSSNALSLAGIAVDDCATACLDESTFACDVFTYCYTSGDCHLNTNKPANNTDLVTMNPFCDLYTRLYLDNYQQYPGQVLESRADHRVTVSGGAEECARLCSMTSTFTCRSFDLCVSTGDCLLRQVHVLDEGVAVSNSTFCSHYSRNYVSDFTVQAGKVVSGHDDTVIDGVTAATCAYQCVSEVSCHSFEFCGGQCRLASVQPSPAMVSDSGSCDLYVITANATAADRGKTPPASTRPPAGTPPASTRPPAGKPSTVTSRTSSTPNVPVKPRTDSPMKQTSSSSPVVHTMSRGPGSGTNPDPPPTQSNGCTQQQTGDNSSGDTGARVGLSLGMLVVGVCLGAGLLVLVQRVRGRRDDDTGMELVPRRR
ncbi:uncharacterized protein [Littorina saxatilis]